VCYDWQFVADCLTNSMSKKANLMRVVSTHKRKAVVCFESVEAIINHGRAAVFLNKEKIEQIALTAVSSGTLADHVIAARDASEALQNYSKLLESKRKFLEGQEEVSVYTFMPSLIFYCYILRES